MGRPRTSWELDRLAAIAKAREAARKAAQAALAPKPYKARTPGGEGYFRSIEDENLFVKMPIPAKAGTTLVGDPGGLGGFTLAGVTAIANSAVVGFKGNHKSVLRVRISIVKTTPTEKRTAWGTRVVDHWDEGFTVPFGAPANGSLEAAKTAFTAAVTGTGTLTGALGTRKGSKAELMYGKRVIAKKVV